MRELLIAALAASVLQGGGDFHKAGSSLRSALSGTPSYLLIFRSDAPAALPGAGAVRFGW